MTCIKAVTEDPIDTKTGIGIRIGTRKRTAVKLEQASQQASKGKGGVGLRTTEVVQAKAVSLRGLCMIAGKFWALPLRARPLHRNCTPANRQEDTRTGFGRQSLGEDHRWELTRSCRWAAEQNSVHPRSLKNVHPPTSRTLYILCSIEFLLPAVPVFFRSKLCRTNLPIIFLLLFFSANAFKVRW